MSAEIPTKAGKREWTGLAVLALPCFLYVMDLTVLNLAIPHLSADLQPDAAQLLWIIDIYGFLVAGCLITMGTLGDRIGRRKLLMIGSAAFGAASVLAAFAPTAEALIAARALLGVAGATIAPSTLSLIRNMFHDPAERTFAIAVWGTSYTVGGAVGPLLGGVMLNYFWWGSVFLLALPVMVLLLIVGPFLLPEYRDPKAGRIDLLSAALSLSAVLAATYGVKRAAESGIDWLPALSIAAGVVLGVLFVRRQGRLDDPLMDLSLFRAPAFSTALGVNVLGAFIAFGAFLFIYQHLQLVVELSPLEAGLWMLPPALAITAGSMLAPAIVGRFKPATVIATGLGLLAFGLLLLTQANGPDQLHAFIAGATVMHVGLGPVFILTTDIIVGSALANRAGAAGALSETGAEFGGVLGIACLGSIAIAVYRGAMADSALEGIPPGIAEAARDTLGAAVAGADQIGGTAGAALVATAREAFGQGFVIAAGISAVLAVAGAVLALVILRDRGTGTDDTDEAVVGPAPAVAPVGKEG